MVGELCCVCVRFATQYCIGSVCAVFLILILFVCLSSGHANARFHPAHTHTS